MSRRIVQIAATAGDVAVRGGNISVDCLYALDNNGVAWVMGDPAHNARWVRLPPLPSIDTRPPAPIATVEGAEP